MNHAQSNVKSFSELFSLSHSVTIIVPSTIDANVKAHSGLIGQVQDTVKVELSSKFGGVTATSGSGGWVSDSLGYISEDVILIQSFFEKLDSEAEKTILGLAHYIKESMSQEAVSIILDGTLYLY